MISDYQKNKIDNYVASLHEFYSDSSKGYFKGSNFPNELNAEDLLYLSSNISLEKLVGAEKHFILNVLLANPEKEIFAKYLLRTSSIPLEVNRNNEIYKSNFQLLFKITSKEKGGFYGSWLMGELYQRGYQSTVEDEKFLVDFYKSNLTSEDMFLNWCIARICFKLNDPKKIQYAQEHANVLFAILSFKQNKPVGFNYPNLLAIINTALTSYRTNGDIILHAMKYYGVYEKTKGRDKKGAFAFKEQDYHQFKPIQDMDFREIIFQIFPELQNAPI